MGAITVQSLETTGATIAFTAASSGLADEFINDGETYLHIKNGAATTNAVVIISQFSPVPKGLAKTNITVSLAGTEERIAGPFLQAAWNDSSGDVQITCTTHTNLFYAAISLNT